MRSDKIKGIVLILCALALMGFIFWGMQKDDKSEETASQGSSNTKTEDLLPETTEAANKEETEEYPQEESELSDIQCEICDMRTEVREQIKNYTAFTNAVKNWMLMNGYTDEKIISRNDVTTQYDSGKRLYWMILEKNNKSFYVVEDMQSGTCKTKDKK